MIVGVSVSGVWQFFAHKPDPNWFDYVPGSSFNAQQAPATAMAQIHDLFATGSGIVALVGSAWFAYRIAHGVPIATIVAVIGTLSAALTGALLRFNLVKLEGRSFEEVGAGYAQLFSNDVEYVVTDTVEFGPAAFTLLTVAHVATIPILVGFGWWSIQRALDRRTTLIQNAPKRTWFTDVQHP